MLGIYSRFEKPFERDGLYWVQYGLALRHFGYQMEALDKLRTAVQAHEQAHTLHAFAQQQIIVATSEGVQRALAEQLVDGARETLERLSREAKYDDSYPLNVLAKGHTAFVRNAAGDKQARIIAASYADRIHQTGRTSVDAVLGRTWSWLSRYAVGGRWRKPDLTRDGGSDIGFSWR